jgi:hypothetical protein
MKKKGSALILSILMLSFFMTIALTMYYVARNRSKRSVYKIKGITISGGLDSGSSIAHYELYLADKYVSEGYLYNTSGGGIDYRGDNATYIPPTSTIKYITEVTSDGVVTLVPEIGKHYTGVVLNNYNEYFSALWDPTIIGTSTVVSTGSAITDPNVLDQPWLAEEKVIGTSPSSVVMSRIWLNNNGEKIVRLWTLDKTKDDPIAISVGGYRLTKVNGVEITGNLKDAVPTTGTTIKFTYEKIVSLDKSKVEEVGKVEEYRIEYVELITTSGGSIIADKLESMTVEKLK